MTEILIAMASWLAINVVTWLSWKLWVSKTYVSVGMAIIIWVLVYVMQIIIDKYPMQWEQIVAFASWAYATSQIVRNLWNKIKEKEQK